MVLPRTPVGRSARLGALGSRLSGRWLWARLRAALRPHRRQEILDQYHLKSAEQVAELMGNMKGAIMKLGQMMSFVTDDVPEQYRVMLQQLQSNAPPMAFELARQVIEHELGGPLRHHFRDLDESPLAAASIGQVHRARLRSGEDVVVKVQYPGVDDAIRADLTNVDWMYTLLAMLHPGLDPKPLAEELRARIGEELDYRLEARNQQLFLDLYDEHPVFRIPQVYPAHSTARVLTSAFVAGERFEWLQAQPEPLRQRSAEVLYRFVFDSIGRHYVFNGDPHPGNYLFHADGTVTFLDFGCVKYFGLDMMRRWHRLLRAHFESRPEPFRELLVSLGFIPASASATAERLYRYFAYFYEPFRTEGVYTFSTAYTAKSFGMMFDRANAEWGDLLREFNMPADFAFVNRIQWGLWSILAHLGATNHWHAIHREHLYGDAGATALGRECDAWRTAWRRRRGLAPDAAVWLEPSGLRNAPAPGPLVQPS